MTTCSVPLAFCLPKADGLNYQREQNRVSKKEIEYGVTHCFSLYTMFLQMFKGIGQHSLLQARLRTAYGNITICGIRKRPKIFCTFCSIHTISKRGRGPRNTIRRDAGWTDPTLYMWQENTSQPSNVSYGA